VDVCPHVMCIAVLGEWETIIFFVPASEISHWEIFDFENKNFSVQICSRTPCKQRRKKAERMYVSKPVYLQRMSDRMSFVGLFQNKFLSCDFKVIVVLKFCIVLGLCIRD